MNTMSQKNAIIWHLTSGKEFPIQIWKHPRINIELSKVPLDGLGGIDLLKSDIHVFFLSVSLEEWNEIREFIRKFELHPYASLILIYSDDAEKISKTVPENSKIEVLEHPVHPRNLRLILDRTIQSEFYKLAANEIGNSCLTNIGFFEGVFELAQKEYKDATKANEALQAILEFESKVKKNNEEINEALERVNELKNKELLALHERLKVSEILDSMKTQELKDALDFKKATEQALNYSHIEEIKMDRILEAQDRLFAYTEKEIKELIEENRNLKKRLGI
ncbi:hypothetical protein LEP1GSC171_2781 [Leptospira santarosai str. HAI1380]|uniref:Uncharacterized protein n=6 Tax=Leptospira santarosai TaxID=28183 RepID=M6V6M9_9LEPT|nr:hypothetical protein B2G51_03695 [Leptospira santarosai]EKR93212.1 hypothetical protein LEP1GSC163_1063 [Leptospira santarosai str. CBC379]EKT86145.1 hypothetical protein LSS_13709 [Leptospira santarosai serovar Shermani str. LT 821]EMJ46736.1 hypothetical protein LEP1GSC169_0778 [Leptospira santarosai str. HAI1349]EMO45148.1 hypothetical protein LEP1GSC187_1780 [Leptospira santarosai str. ZUN179]EMO70246.1 hypothetical protein LEP1GSC130_3239 [Leptospira santarosai str. 200403458]EMO84449